MGACSVDAALPGSILLEASATTDLAEVRAHLLATEHVTH